MLIDIFIPTGEVRQAKDFEFMMIHGGWSYGPSNLSHPIGIRYQVESPEECCYLDVIPYHKDGHRIWANAITIPLPHPKKKVKKWQWVLPHQWGENSCFMTSYFTDDEVNENYPDKGWYHKISETEIEVSE